MRVGGDEGRRWRGVVMRIRKEGGKGPVGKEACVKHKILGDGLGICRQERMPVI